MTYRTIDFGSNLGLDILIPILLETGEDMGWSPVIKSAYNKFPIKEEYTSREIQEMRQALGLHIEFYHKKGILKFPAMETSTLNLRYNEVTIFYGFGSIGIFTSEQQSAKFTGKLQSKIQEVYKGER